MRSMHALLVLFVLTAIPCASLGEECGVLQECPSGGGGYYGGLAWDGTHLWMTGHFGGMPGGEWLIVQVDPTTCATIHEIPSPADRPSGLAWDGSSLYVGLNTVPARVVKLETKAMKAVSQWVGGEGQDHCRSLPAKVIEVDPADMSTVSVWVSDASQRRVAALAFDGSYIYAGLDTYAAQVVKIDPQTMETVDVWLGAGDQNCCMALLFDGEHLYAGLETWPAQVVKIAPQTMTTVRRWTAEQGQDQCLALTFDGLHVLAGFFESPGQVVRLIL